MRDIQRLQIFGRKQQYFEKAQERQRSNQNKKLATKSYIIEVLYNHHEQPKWEGPYFIQDIKEQSIGLERRMTWLIKKIYIIKNI